MPISFRKGACAGAAALALMAGAAQAGNHLVMIVDGGYFPAVTYAKPGDNLVFENKSSGTHTLSGPDNVWESEPIGIDGRYVLNLTNETPLTFMGIASDGIQVSGEISYDDPPLAD